jgi:hypothetical protein
MTSLHLHRVARDEKIRPRLSWGSGSLNRAIVANQVNAELPIGVHCDDIR